GVFPDEVHPAEIDETPRKGELPRPHALRLAAEKARALEAPGDALVLAADTVVAAGRRILGKPRDEGEAERFLRLLSGRRHRVITAVAVGDAGGVASRAVETAVRFKRLADDEVAAYLAGGEWKGKAGGYAIQGLAGAFVP